MPRHQAPTALILRRSMRNYQTDRRRHQSSCVRLTPLIPLPICIIPGRFPTAGRCPSSRWSSPPCHRIRQITFRSSAPAFLAPQVKGDVGSYPNHPRQDRSPSIFSLDKKKMPQFWYGFEQTALILQINVGQIDRSSFFVVIRIITIQWSIELHPRKCMYCNLHQRISHISQGVVFSHTWIDNVFFSLNKYLF